MSKSKKSAHDMPLFVDHNPNLVAIWEDSSDDVQKAASLLLEFKGQYADAPIMSYFDFTDSWQSLFPKRDKGAYDRNSEIIKKGAKLAGVSPSTVYSILRTTMFYGRKGYESLKKKSEANGVTVYWTHLRLVSDRLHDNPAARTEIERLMVQNQMTERQLLAEVDRVSPETKKSNSSSAGDVNNISRLCRLTKSFDAFVKQCSDLSQCIQAINDEFQGDLEDGKIIFGQTKQLIRDFELLCEFLDAESVEVTNLHNIVDVFLNKAENQAVQTHARNVQNRLLKDKTDDAVKEKRRTEHQAYCGDIQDEPPHRSQDISDAAPDIFNLIGDIPEHNFS